MDLNKINPDLKMSNAQLRELYALVKRLPPERKKEWKDFCEFNNIPIDRVDTVDVFRGFDISGKLGADPCETRGLSAGQIQKEYDKKADEHYARHAKEFKLTAGGKIVDADGRELTFTLGDPGEELDPRRMHEILKMDKTAASALTKPEELIFRQRAFGDINVDHPAFDSGKKDSSGNIIYTDYKKIAFEFGGKKVFAKDPITGDIKVNLTDEAFMARGASSLGQEGLSYNAANKFGTADAEIGDFMGSYVKNSAGAGLSDKLLGEENVPDDLKKLLKNEGFAGGIMGLDKSLSKWGLLGNFVSSAAGLKTAAAGLEYQAKKIIVNKQNIARDNSILAMIDNKSIDGHTLMLYFMSYIVSTFDAEIREQERKIAMKKKIEHENKDRKDQLNLALSPFKIAASFIPVVGGTASTVVDGIVQKYNNAVEGATMASAGFDSTEDDIDMMVTRLKDLTDKREIMLRTFNGIINNENEIGKNFASNLR